MFARLAVRSVSCDEKICGIYKQDVLSYVSPTHIGLQHNNMLGPKCRRNTLMCCISVRVSATRKSVDAVDERCLRGQVSVTTMLDQVYFS